MTTDPGRIVLHAVNHLASSMADIDDNSLRAIRVLLSAREAIAREAVYSVPQGDGDDGEAWDLSGGF